jgi:HD domain.
MANGQSGQRAEVESVLVDAARAWVIEKYPYNRDHLVRSLEWLDRLAPGSREAVRLATLTHDMERAFPGPDQPVAKRLDDPVYNKAHSERSARIVGAWLREMRADDALVRDVEELIRVHEDGGWPEANLVQAADSLSFLDTNIDLFLGFVRSGRFPAADVRGKCQYSYDRIQVPHAKALALPLLEHAIERLAALEMTLPRASA